MLHRALLAARTADLPALAADILRELAFVDVQAGRDTSADRALREASQHACGDPGLLAGILAIQGMNQADRGRHAEAAELLTESAGMAREAGRARQEAWSQGILARSLLLAGQVQPAQEAAERSTAVALSERWNAFLPWPQVLHAQCLAAAGRWDEASEDAEHAFALACELGDPCWEGMAARALGLLALHAGDLGAAQVWLADARAAAIGCQTGTCGSPPTSAWPSWKRPPARTSTWSHLLRPGSTSTRCAATCRSSWPGRWCTRPSLATMPKSRWRAARLLASPTPFCRPGSGPCRPVSSTAKPGERKRGTAARRRATGATA